LAADQGLLAALKRGQELDGYQETPHCAQETHGYWMIFAHWAAHR